MIAPQPPHQKSNLFPPYLLLFIVPHVIAQRAGTAVSNFSTSAFTYLNPEVFANKISELTYKISVVGFVASTEKLASWHLRRGILHTLSRNPNAAVVDFNQSIKYKNSFLPNYLLATLLQFQLGDYENAVKYYNAAMDISSGYQTAQQLAQFLDREVDATAHGSTEPFGDLALQARDAVTSLFQRIQVSATVRQQMSNTVAADTKQLAALKAFNDSLKQVTRTWLLGCRGSCYLSANVNEFQSAYADYYQAHELEPENALFLFNCGVAMSYARSFEQAYKVLTDCIALLHTKQQRQRQQQPASSATSTSAAAPEPLALEDHAEATTVMKKAYRLRAFIGQYLELDKQLVDADIAAANALSSDAPIALDQLLYYRLIPDALVATILSFLPKHDLVAAMRACRHMYKLACTPFLWRSISLNARNIFKVVNVQEVHVSTTVVTELAQRLEKRRSKVTRLTLEDRDGGQFGFLLLCVMEEPFDKVADSVEELVIRGTELLCCEVSAPVVLRFKNLKRALFERCRLQCSTAVMIGAALKLEEIVLRDCELDFGASEYKQQLQSVVPNVIVKSTK